MIVVGVGVFVTGLVAYLFYDCLIGLCLGIVIVPGVYLYYSNYISKSREEQLKREFREVLLSLSNGLSAGVSVEYCFLEAEKNLGELFGDTSVLKKDLFYLNQRVQMGTAVEKGFAWMASKCNLKDMKTFSELFLYAKRMGGDYTKNIRLLALRMDERIGMKEELETQMAEKMLELKIMAVVPIGILLYLKITSREFLSPMYGNLAGVLIMSGCLALYFLSIGIGIYVVKKTLEA